MAALGRIKRILIGALLGGTLAAAYFLGGGAVHSVSTVIHAAPQQIAGGCAGGPGPC
jgi:hypothetical protein